MVVDEAGRSRKLVGGLVGIRHELVDEVVEARKGSIAYLHERSLLLLRQRVRDQCLLGLGLTCGSIHHHDQD